MSSRSISARILLIAVAAALLASVGPSDAVAARAQSVRPTPLRFVAPHPNPPLGARDSRGPYHAPISASVRAVKGNPDDAILTIMGGVGPFKVSLVGVNGPITLYTGSLRRVTVPVLAGVTTYRVEPYSFISSAGYSIAAEGPSTETSITGDTKFWVANTSSRMVRRYDAAVDTITVNTWVRGDDTTSSVILRNVAVRPSDDHVFVVFSDNMGGTTRNRLIELDAAGSFVATIPVPGAYKIQDVTFDSGNNIYVSDRGGGYYAANRVKIVKLSPTAPYDVLVTTQTVLPANAHIGYPMVNLTTMLDYQPIANKVIARINTGTFAVVNPSTLAIESYRFSGDYCYTCMALNTSDETSVTLYTGGSGFYLPAFFGKQSGFLNDNRYLDPSIIRSPFHDWIVTPTLPAITDVAVDSNNYVYTIQHDGVNGITRAYIVNPGGTLVQTVDLPDGTRIAVVR